MIDTSRIKEQLEKYGITPNKALGQNFLCDDAAIGTIAGFFAEPFDPVLEIGPGMGALTHGLIDRGMSVTAVELDKAMCAVLAAEFEGCSALNVINSDILKFDLAQMGKSYSVAGNLPYYITTPICTRLLCTEYLPRSMALMMQKEAALRFFAKPGTKLYGPMCILAELYYDVKRLLELGPSSYYPQPDVDSTVLTFTRKEDVIPLSCLPRLLDQAFSMRRKTVVNNLKGMGISKEEAVKLLESLNLDANIRAEQITPADFYRMAKALEN